MNKIGTALLAALPVIPGFLLGKELSGGRRSWGYLLAGLLGVSFSLTYLSIDLIKNLGAMGFFLFSLYYLFRFEKGERNKSVIIPGIVFLVLGMLSHRSILVLSMVYLGVFTFRLLPFKTSRKLIALVIGSLGLGFLLFFIRGIHPSDIGRFAGVFSAVPSLPFLSKGLTFIWPAGVLWEISICFFIPYILLFLRKKQFGIMETINLVILFAIFHPFWNLKEMDMGARLFLVAAPLSLVLLISVLSKLRPQTNKSQFNILQKTVITVFSAVFIFWAPLHVYNPKIGPPYRFYDRVLKTFNLPVGSKLICHRGMNLFYTYKSKNEGLSYIPDFKINKQKLWRLSYFVSISRYEKYIPTLKKKGLVKTILFPYLLIREDAWQTFLRKIPKNMKERLNNSYNPYKKKPWFLRKQQGY